MSFIRTVKNAVSNALLLIYTVWALLVFTLLCIGIFMPCALLLPRVTQRRQAGNLTLRIALKLAAIKLTAKGLEHLPSGGCVVVANHSSYLDGPILAAVLPPQFCLVIKREASNTPLVGFFLRRIDHQFVERHQPRGAARDAQQLIQRLRRGEEVGVFAEGTFVAQPGILPFKPGAFVGAVRAQVPVVPAAISGTRHIFPAGSLLLRPGKIEVTLLPPIYSNHAQLTVREASKQIAAEARQAIADVVKEPLV